MIAVGFVKDPIMKVIVHILGFLFLFVFFWNSLRYSFIWTQEGLIVFLLLLWTNSSNNDQLIPRYILDRACANLDRISRVMKNDTLACSMDWDATSFEKVADEIDREQDSNFSQPSSAELHRLSRQYYWYRHWNSSHIYNESTCVRSSVKGKVHWSWYYFQWNKGVSILVQCHCFQWHNNGVHCGKQSENEQARSPSILLRI